MEHGFTIKDAVYLILILAAIVALFAAVITVGKYGRAMQNPMGSCMAQFNLNSCVCYDNDGRMIPINSVKYNASANSHPFQPEYSNLDLGVFNGTS